MVPPLSPSVLFSFVEWAYNEWICQIWVSKDYIRACNKTICCLCFWIHFWKYNTAHCSHIRFHIRYIRSKNQTSPRFHAQQNSTLYIAFSNNFINIVKIMLHLGTLYTKLMNGKNAWAHTMNEIPIVLGKFCTTPANFLHNLLLLKHIYSPIP